MTYSLEIIAEKLRTWLTTGKFDAELIANDFQFNSPYWQNLNKQEFVSTFLNSTDYEDITLKKIKSFDLVESFVNLKTNHIAIISIYTTKNNITVNESLFAKVKNNQLSRLTTIYDLDETKKALDIE